MALVRVYCGLASANPATRPDQAGTALVSAVVDDAGRLLHVCEVSDDPTGYARLAAVFVERCGALTGVAVAADSDDHVVTSLLNAAGRPLAVADDDLVDDFAERFADDDSAEEIAASEAQRRAVGLARALQAGALSATTLNAPRDLTPYKPVLAAHAALAAGRHAAAVALREVLRELYPAALRAYPDPAEQIPLAILDAVPQPAMLDDGTGQGDPEAADAILSRLVNDGVADDETAGEAITALWVAISETSRRTGADTTAPAAEAVRQAVAAVRAYDAAAASLVSALAARATTSVPEGRRSRRASAEPAASAGRTGRLGGQEPNPPVGRRSRHPASPDVAVGQPRPVTPPPVAPAAVNRPPVAPEPVAARPEVTTPARPAAAHRPPPANRPVSAAPPPPPGISAAPQPGRRGIPPVDAGEPFRATLTTAAINSARIDRQRTIPLPPRAQPKPDPVAEQSEPEQRHPAVGFGASDVAVPLQRPEPQPAPPGSRANWPLVNSARDDDQARIDLPASAGQHRPTGAGPATREIAEPRDASDVQDSPHGTGTRDGGADDRPARDGAADASRGAPRSSRITPPWLADDLPAEPPVLRLVEPPQQVDADEARRSRRDDPAPAARPARPDTSGRPAARPEPASRAEQLDPRPLRLVEQDENGRRSRLAQAFRPAGGDNAGARETLDRETVNRETVNRDAVNPAALGYPAGLPGGPSAAPPVERNAADDDLLIFAAAQSAWFTHHPEQEEAKWSSTADNGWRAAEQAAEPAVGDETEAGLPRRVPQANLVPGSPLRDERPLRIVRNAASLAENTTGYFRGWRRGQEIGGFAVGGRPGREAAGGWDFSRDPGEVETADNYQYRSVSYRS